jgi:PAS domain S-box-containing protein
MKEQANMSYFTGRNPFLRAGLPAAAIIFVAGAVGIWLLIVQTDRTMRKDLADRAKLVAESLNLEQVKALTGTEADLESAVYLRLKGHLASIRAAESQCHFVYLLGRKADGRVYFFVDSEPVDSEDESPAGQIYEEAPDGYRRVFDTGSAEVEGPISDRWGTWVTALIPLTDPQNGEVCAVLGMDIGAHDWKRDRVARAALPVIPTMLALLFIVLAASHLFARRARLEVPPPHWMAHLETILAAAVGLVLTLFVALLVQEASDRNLADSFRHLAGSKTAAVAETFRNLRDVELGGLAKFYENSNSVGAEEFRNFTEYLTRNRAVQAWEWIPCVQAADKERFEEEARASGLDGFEIWQRDASGGRTPATGRETYYPVFRASPEEGNRSVIGFDLGSEKIRRAAIEEALRTGLPTATESVTLVQETGNQKGMLLFHPVFSDAERQHPLGLALAALRFGDLLAATGSANLVSEEMILVHEDGTLESPARSRTGIHPRYPTLVICRPMPDFGRTLLVSAHPGPEFLRGQPIISAGWRTGLTGVLLTIALAVVVSVLCRRREELERLVRDRTADLQESEFLQRELLFNLPAGVVIVDPETRQIEQVNQFAAAIFGASADRLIGRRCHAFLCPAEEGACPVCDLGSKVDNSERVMLRADGSRLPILKTVNRVLLGGREKLLECFVDITERKRAEEKLHQAMQIVENVQIGFYLYRLEDKEDDRTLRMIYANPATETMTGLARSDIIGKTLDENFPGLRQMNVPQRYADVVRTQEARGFEDMFYGDERIVNKAFSVKAFPLSDNHVGVAFEDVTEQWTAKQKMEIGNRRLREAQEVGKVGSWEYDFVSGRLEWSDQTYRIYGENQNTFVPSFDGVLHFYPESDRKQVLSEVDKAVQGSDVLEVDHRIVRRSGETVYVHESGRVVRSENGNPLRITGCVLDVTARKKAEAWRDWQFSFQKGIAEASSRFINVSSDEDFCEAVETTLRAFGELLGLDRAYVFRFSTDLTYMSNTHEWCTPGIDGQKERCQRNETTSMPWWMEKIANGRSVQITDTDELPDEAAAERTEFKAQGIRSLICLPMFGGKGILTGFLGFDAVRSRHTWSEDQVTLLQVLAEIVANAFERRDIIASLHKSEKRQRLLFEYATIGIATHEIVTDAQGEIVNYVFLSANPAFERQTGLKCEDVIGRRVTEVLPGIENTDLIRTYGNVVSTGKPVDFEMYSPPLARHYSITAYRISENRFATVFSDITERKRTENVLKESEERFNLAIHGTGAGLWDWDMKTGAVYFSAQWKSMLGYEDHEVENAFSGWKNLWHPDDKAMIEQFVNDHLEGRTERYEVEHRLRHKNGAWRWILTRGEIRKDAAGNPVRWTGTNLDVTDRKLAEMELEKTKREYESVLNTQKEMICRFRPDTTLTFVNDAYCRAFGKTREELEGTTWLNLVAGENHDAIRKHIASLCEKKGIITYEHTAFTADGSVAWQEWTDYIIASEKGEVTELQSVGYDITERKRAAEALNEMNEALERQTLYATEMAAQAEAASAAKSEFLANMSHEIRTPMNGVIGMTGLLLDSDLDNEQRRQAEIVRSSAESLLGLLNDILDFSKIEAGKLDLETLDFDLEAVLDDLVATVAVKAHEKGLELLYAAEADVPTLLKGDPGRLRQILTNLAGNAIKFTASGEVAIHVSAESQDRETVRLRFRVRDTGIGIPEEKTGLLFDKFSQIDASTSRRFGGTGLGLAISKQLARMMGGEIGVTSEVGRGSEFWFTVHVEKQPEERMSAIADPVAELHDLRTLIVDDNATNREILTARLTAWNMRTAEAENGREALRMLRQAMQKGDPFRLALIDMQMPAMDGAELGRLIQSDPQLKETRMIMLTSLGTKGDAHGTFVDIGFAGWLVKPVRKKELMDGLRKAMQDSAGSDRTENADRRIDGDALQNFHGRGARILLAEDNITNQQVALGILKKLGLKADAVADGNEAVEAIRTLPYDLVLMDVQMPGMDGYEATRRIRNMSPEKRAIPIIAMTAHAMRSDRERSFAAGMDEHVTKPVSMRMLAEAIEKCLRAGGHVFGAPETEHCDTADHQEKGVRENPSIWNRQDMLDRLLGDEDLLESIMNGFVDDIPRQMAALACAIRENDSPTATRLAHTIRGAAANVSGEELRKTAGEIEQDAKSGRLDAAKSRLESLRTAFERLRTVAART